MRIDFAPMEGITGAAFRRCHKKYFGGIDRYYAPFISPAGDHIFTKRDKLEIYPEYNEGIELVPQLMAKNAEDFLWAAGELAAMGYKSVNLNAGCPSGTVTAKGKGAGMLSDVAALDAFLSAIFEKAPCPISVKTRLGMNEPEEFWAVLEIYNKYPISELIIHPRVRKDFYREKPRMEYFRGAAEKAKMPLSFNGGIVSNADCRKIMEEFPSLEAVMLGQGIVADPFLAEKVKGDAKPDVKTLREFHGELFESYALQFQSRNNAAARMKELWSYLIQSFGDSEKLGKQIRKAKNAEEFLAAAERVFAEKPLLERSAGNW